MHILNLGQRSSILRCPAILRSHPPTSYFPAQHFFSFCPSTPFRMHLLACASRLALDAWPPSGITRRRPHAQRPWMDRPHSPARRDHAIASFTNVDTELCVARLGEATDAESSLDGSQQPRGTPAPGASAGML
jgi:hypothetical protein